MRKEKSGETISHDGIVEKVGADSVDVRISSGPACTGCHAEGLCGYSGKEEKIINIAGKYDVSPGNRVTVLMKLSMGYKATLLGYIMPLVIVIATLILLVSLSVPEWISGLVSVGVLAPYFIVLYFFRKRIDQSFTFTLKA